MSASSESSLHLSLQTVFPKRSFLPSVPHYLIEVSLRVPFAKQSPLHRFALPTKCDLLSRLESSTNVRFMQPRIHSFPHSSGGRTRRFSTIMPYGQL